MAAQESPLDEIQFRDPQALMEMGAIHDNTVLFYFARSPFFDQTSNNAILFSQAMFNPKMLPIIQTRQAFEARLKTMSGLEFIVAQEPAETGPGAGTGVWVIRKQVRRKRPGEEDEIAVQGTYFVVGENIYMAPALSDILSGRMLQVTDSLNKFVSAAAALPEFSPALGHTYLPPSTKPAKGDGFNSQTSKEPTPLPESLQTKKPYVTTQTNAQLSNQLLAETLNITMKYGDEYMDENLITGQPGDFHLSTAGRKKQDTLTVPGAPKGPLSLPKPTPPPTLKTDVAPARKGSKSEKSPKTPGIPKPKRRKSKGINSAGGLSPK